jgi:hypothetical protein
MGDVVYCAAFPKSGVTYMNLMLFYSLFEPPHNVDRFEIDHIIDIHAYPTAVPPPGGVRRYAKTHAPFDGSLALRDRADRAICLVRDPSDVMMSLWDYVHLTGSEALLNAPDAVREELFREFVAHWIASGGDPERFAGIGFTGSWVRYLSSWLDQCEIPTVFVRYEALKADPVGQLVRILDFLELAVPRDRLEFAARKSTPSEMRKQEQSDIDSKAGGFYRSEFAAAYQKGFRFVGRLHASSYHSVLTEAQRRDVDRLFGSVLARVDARIA